MRDLEQAREAADVRRRFLEKASKLMLTPSVLALLERLTAAGVRCYALSQSLPGFTSGLRDVAVHLSPVGHVPALFMTMTSMDGPAPADLRPTLHWSDLSVPPLSRDSGHLDRVLAVVRRIQASAADAEAALVELVDERMRLLAALKAAPVAGTPG